MLFNEIEELRLEDDPQDPSAPRITSHVPINTPILLQCSLNGLFLTDSGGDKVALSTTSLGTKGLFRFCSVYEATLVALQSLSSGNFLSTHSRKFSQQKVSKENSLQIKIENKLLHFLLNLDSKKSLSFKAGTAELSHVDFPGWGWRLIFPIPPLTKTLNCNIFVPSSTMLLNKLPYNIPLQLQCVKNSFLGFDMHTAKAWSILTEESIFNEIIFRRVSEGKVAIEARKLGTFLHVHPNEKCAFTSQKIEDTETFLFSFDTEFNVNLFSCHNNKALQFDTVGDICCNDSWPGDHGKWKIQILAQFDIPLKKSESVFGLHFYYD